VDKRKHIALLVDTSTTWGSDVIRGALRYARQQPQWVVHIEPRGKYEVVVPPSNWRGHGLIARITNSQLAEYISGLGMVAVNVSWYPFHDPEARIAHCTTDVQVAGQMCAEHFLERGLRNVAYCGASHRPNYVDELEQSFSAAMKLAGLECAVFESRTKWLQGGFQIEHGELCAWLRALPKPVGILTFDSVRGHQITEVCRSESIRVPEEVSVLAGDHDAFFSEVSVPQLSTLDISPQRVGHRAAQILDRLLHGERCPEDAERIPPGGITTRQSTDILAIRDTALADAIRFIHDHANEAIRVRDVLRAVPLSRRLLEQKFRATLGRSPAAEIRTRKIEMVKKLLETTDLQLSSIADQTGFQHVEVLTRLFRRTTGIAPTDYRKRMRLGKDARS
jgi:LacI family transcriptional regulator